MARQAVIHVVTDAASRDAAEPWLDRVGAAWPGDPPQWHRVEAEAALAGKAKLSAGVVWFVLDRPATGELFELVAQAEDRHLPALLTRRDHDAPLGTEQHDGVVHAPWDADPAAVAAVLQTMLSQGRVIESLKLEAKALQTQTRGVGAQLGKVEEELRLAGKLQREFLPRELPELHGVKFDVLWQPAGYVGGDIYDAFRLDERHMGFFIADAVGHGVPAALMTMVIKQSLETKTVSAESSRGYRLIYPGEALARLNRDMAAMQSGQVRFATACYGVIDCVERRLTLARAGHPYPLLLRSDGTREHLEVEGGLLGVFPEEEYEQASVTLGVGDRLLVFSDGFETAFPEPAETAASADGHHEPHRAIGKLVTERYLEEFAVLAQGPVETGLATIEKRVHGEAGSLDQKDDLTLMCLSVDAVAAAAAA